MTFFTVTVRGQYFVSGNVIFHLLKHIRLAANSGWHHVRTFLSFLGGMFSITDQAQTDTFTKEEVAFNAPAERSDIL